MNTTENKGDTMTTHDHVRALSLIPHHAQLVGEDGEILVTANSIARDWAQKNKIEDGAARNTLEEAIQAVLDAKCAVAEVQAAYEAARAALAKAEDLALSTDRLTALLGEVLDDPLVAALPNGANWRMRAAIGLIRR